MFGSGSRKLTIPLNLKRCPDPSARNDPEIRKFKIPIPFSPNLTVRQVNPVTRGMEPIVEVRLGSPSPPDGFAAVLLSLSTMVPPVIVRWPRSLLCPATGAIGRTAAASGRRGRRRLLPETHAALASKQAEGKLHCQRPPWL